jgi:hypothetical protein
MEMPIQLQPWIVGGGLFQCFAANCIVYSLKIFISATKYFQNVSTGVIGAAL